MVPWDAWIPIVQELSTALSLQPSPIHGTGLFAQRDLAAGEPLAIVTGTFAAGHELPAHDQHSFRIPLPLIEHWNWNEEQMQALQDDVEMLGEDWDAQERRLEQLNGFMPPSTASVRKFVRDQQLLNCGGQTERDDEILLSPFVAPSHCNQTPLYVGTAEEDRRCVAHYANHSCGSANAEVVSIKVGEPRMRRRMNIRHAQDSKDAYAAKLQEAGNENRIRRNALAAQRYSEHWEDLEHWAALAPMGFGLPITDSGEFDDLWWNLLLPLLQYPRSTGAVQCSEKSSELHYTLADNSVLLLKVWGACCANLMLTLY